MITISFYFSWLASKNYLLVINFYLLMKRKIQILKSSLLPFSSTLRLFIFAYESYSSTISFFHCNFFNPRKKNPCQNYKLHFSWEPYIHQSNFGQLELKRTWKTLLLFLMYLVAKGMEGLGVFRMLFSPFPWYSAIKSMLYFNPLSWRRFLTWTNEFLICNASENKMCIKDYPFFFSLCGYRPSYRRQNREAKPGAA